MPIPTTSKLSKPKSEDEFEDISVDFLRVRWRDPHATRNGRRGQGQDGVDVIGHPPWLKGRAAGAQCKNTDHITLNDVIVEASKAESFAGGIAEFLLVTSADRDARLQAEVREHFRANQAPFHVHVIFWADITADLAQDDKLIEKHWRTAAVQPHVANLQSSSVRAQLAVIRAEARRMKEHAEHLNAGFHHGFWDQYIRLRFRPKRLESVDNGVLAALADRQVLLSGLDQLVGTAGAADRETERFLEGDPTALSNLLPLLLNVMSSAHQVESQIEQALRQTA